MKFYGKGDGDMREKKDLFGRIGKYLDLPAEVLPGGFSVLLSGRELCVHGRAAIRAYREDRVVICVGKQVLIAEGERLFCAELSAQKTVIIGTVTALFLKKEGEDAT